MNVQELQEIFKEQIDAGLSVASFLVSGLDIDNKEFIQEDEIHDSKGIPADSLSVAEKKSIYTTRLYADLSELEEIANDALFDCEFVKMNGSEPVVVPSRHREAIKELHKVFKDKIVQGLKTARIFIEDEYFTNDTGERRVRIRVKDVDITELGMLAANLSGISYKRTQEDFLIFGKS